MSVGGDSKRSTLYNTLLRRVLYGKVYAGLPETLRIIKERILSLANPAKLI
jgi:hypothetical protein